jgi:hypothetical protein
LQGMGGAKILLSRPRHRSSLAWSCRSV